MLVHSADEMRPLQNGVAPASFGDGVIRRATMHESMHTRYFSPKTAKMEKALRSALTQIPSVLEAFPRFPISPPVTGGGALPAGQARERGGKRGREGGEEKWRE